MSIRAYLCFGLCLVALSVAETTAAAASPQATAATSEQTPAALRRAERVRRRILRRTIPIGTSRNTVAERRRARLLRARSQAPLPATAQADRVLELVNEARAEEGLQPLSLHPILELTAQAYAEDMATRGFFGHEDPDGQSSSERILAGGYAKPTCNCSWRYGTGENLAQGQDTPEEAVSDWLASPGHRRNILDPHFDDTGIGYANEHWVQHFGVSNVLP